MSIRYINYQGPQSVSIGLGAAPTAALPPIIAFITFLFPTCVLFYYIIVLLFFDFNRVFCRVCRQLN